MSTKIKITDKKKNVDGLLLTLDIFQGCEIRIKFV